MNRRSLGRLAAAVLAAGLGAGALPLARAAEEAPDVLVRRLSDEVIDAIRADKTLRSGDVSKVALLVDTRVMPHVNFERMTASAAGPAWRQATPEQKKRLQEEFKTLLLRTYSGALAQVGEERVTVRPLRAAPADTDVIVRSEIRGRGEPIQLDYRLAKAADGWKIYNINVLGVWLVETYRSQFAQEINARGIDGLIATLTERNKTNAGKG